jgi:[acyl-carrier-protein] S-malonyltransferase
MQDAAEASAGGMLALVGADEAVANEVVAAGSIAGKILVAANFNAPGQIVLSGSTECIDKAAEYASGELRMRIAVLDVAGAFHSPLMAPAAERLEKALADTQIGIPDFPVLSNVTGKPHEVGAIRRRLVEQLTSPVRWADCINYIISEQKANGEPYSWAELAPGKTLSGILRKIDKGVKVVNFSSPPVEAAVDAP